MKQIQLTQTTLHDRFFEYAGHCIDGQFIVTTQTQQALELVFKTIEENRYGVCLLGNSGAGKTFVFECLRRILHPQDAQHFQLKSCIGIVQDWNVDGDRIFRDKWVRKNMLWDDLMREPMGNYKNDVMPKVIFNADERYKQQGLKTHFTCNFSPANIEKRYGDYILSRIKGMCQVIGMEPSRDFRDLKNFRNYPMVYHPVKLTVDDVEWNKKYERSKNIKYVPTPAKTQGELLRERVEKFLGSKQQ